MKSIVPKKNTQNIHSKQVKDRDREAKKKIKTRMVCFGMELVWVCHIVCKQHTLYEMINYRPTNLCFVCGVQNHAAKMENTKATTLIRSQATRVDDIVAKLKRVQGKQ